MKNGKKNHLKETIFSELLILFLLFLITSGFFFNKISSRESLMILGKTTSLKDVFVSLAIGERRFRLFGYSSPKALVTLSGLGVFDQTYADNSGYFQFNTFSFFSVKEICLTSQDQFGRLTHPVCVPCSGVNNNSEIGPVILPPTLSLDKSDYWVGDEVILSGQTIPNTDVNLLMFNDKNKKSGLQAKILDFSLIKPANAFSLPKIEIKSDNKGNFSVSLPSSTNENFRLFAQTLFQNQSSPESIKLTLKILPWWMIIIKLFYFLWLLIKPFLLEIVILLQMIFLIVYILKRIFHPKNLAIIKRESLLPVVKRKKTLIGNEARIVKRFT